MLILSAIPNIFVVMGLSDYGVEPIPAHALVNVLFGVLLSAIFTPIVWLEASSKKQSKIWVGLCGWPALLFLLRAVLGI